MTDSARKEYLNQFFDS
ncbi:TPA: hypothetical protein OY296_002333, partial [Staphylococcus aureus]|nr:hypothetical protein [Staphylococcus aureus]HCX1043761.1 hypothetical protein [Staphylococcus aureus]HCX1211933.1 hypothetical protein [Staphylococcus aureus]HCX1542525.1 hypothetical protein [Staphylococcus aureus]HCX1548290.1 hypothetical protein [Staphylococcus aureus]